MLFCTCLKPSVSMENRPKNAFTMLETMIVLIVFSIVLAAFLSGKRAVRNIGAKNTITQIKKYNSSIAAFRKKYGKLPGDIKKTQIFNLSNTNTDGNENGIIDGPKGGIPTRAEGELVNFWLHLSNSGMLDEKYNGWSGSRFEIGKSVPKMQSRDVGIVVFGAGEKNFYQIGVVGANKDGVLMLSDESLKPMEAFLIDNKIDDGLPSQGKIRAAGGPRLGGYKRVNEKCVTGREYFLKQKNPACQLLIEINI